MRNSIRSLGALVALAAFIALVLVPTAAAGGPPWP